MTGKDALKAGAWGALFAFCGAFALTATGWLGDVSEWASTQGQAQFPSLSILGYGLVSAAVGATTGAINAGVRWLQSKGWIPGGGPTYGVTAKNASNQSGGSLRPPAKPDVTRPVD